MKKKQIEMCEKRIKVLSKKEEEQVFEEYKYFSFFGNGIHFKFERGILLLSG